MGIGVSLILIAIGAILWLAVSATVSGIAITTVGVILVVVGIIGLLISLIFLGSHHTIHGNDDDVSHDHF